MKIKYGRNGQLRSKGRDQKMSSLPQLLLTYGPLGLMVILLIVPWPGSDCPVIVPFWYVKKLTEELKLKQIALEHEQEAAKKSLEELQMANRLVGELRAIASARSGGGQGGPAPSPELH